MNLEAVKDFHSVSGTRVPRVFMCSLSHVLFLYVHG